MQSLADGFKDQTLKCLNELLVHFDTLECKKRSPLNMSLLKLGKSLFIDNIDSEKMIEEFILNSNDGWDLMYQRDEYALIDFVKKIIDDNVPMFSSKSEETSKFLLDNRREILTPEYEKSLWEVLTSLIKISLKYCHLKRFPKLDPKTNTVKYTVNFAPDIKLKKEMEKWEVKV